MDNLAIGRVLAEIADLLEIKGENPFKIRAFRNAAETVAQATRRVADLTAAERRELPGIGKDLAARLYGYLGIRSLADLEAAVRTGRLRDVKGMGAKKEAQILKALEEQRRFAGRRRSADAQETAAALVSDLRERAPDAFVSVVGSLRRGCDTCGDIDILAAGGGSAVMHDFTSSTLVERVLVHGETKSSVLLWGGFQADLRLVPRESAGAALQYFTGSRAHNIALRDRAIGRGLKLNEYGLFRIADEARIAGVDEPGIYEALGLAFIVPELRENRGEIEAAEAGTLPRLIDLAELRGDLHCHTDATDGREPVESMASAARAAGLDYLAITDHTQSLAMANGLDERAAVAHARHIREIGSRLEGMTLLAGVECDIKPDGTLDLADDCLAELDYVVASVHSAFNQEPQQMTDRLLRAIDCRWIDTLGHPLGRILLKRDPHRADMTAVIAAAVNAGVALEINSQVDRLDLDDLHARTARDAGARFVVASDAHGSGGFAALRWGVTVARRAWLTPDHVMNTRPVEQFRRMLRRSQTR